MKSKQVFHSSKIFIIPLVSIILLLLIAISLKEFQFVRYLIYPLLALVLLAFCDELVFVLIILPIAIVIKLVDKVRTVVFLQTKDRMYNQK